MTNTLQIINENQPVFFATFPTDNPEGEKKALIASAPANFNLTDLVNGDPITIEDLFLEEVQFTNENDTTRTGIRTVIFDTKGHTYQTSSNSILNSLRRIMQIKGGNIKGCKVKVSSVTTKKGYRAFILIPM